MKRNSSNQRGDTILEVLISVAVLSLILTTTYALANRSSQANRQAAERSEATKIAQSEMEKLKLYVSIPGAILPPEGSYFCMKPDGGGFTKLNGPPPTPDRNADPDFTSMIYNPPGDPPPCRAGANYLYYKLIYRGTTADGTANTYTSYVRWPAITGNGVDEASMVHRLYPELTSVILAAGLKCTENYNIAVSLDRSGSMTDPFTASTNRIDAAKRLLSDFFREADLRPTGNKASLSVWSGETLPYETVRTTTDNFGQLNSALNTFPLDGDLWPAGTNLLYGLNVAKSELDRASPSGSGTKRVIVLLTDGDQANTDVLPGPPPVRRGKPETTRADVIARARDIKRNNVLIYVIGIYPTSRADDADYPSLVDFLDDISSDDGNGSGVYMVAANDEEKAKQMLRNINTTVDLSC